jgi:hypothetical protein
MSATCCLSWTVYEDTTGPIGQEISGRSEYSDRKKLFTSQRSANFNHVKGLATDWTTIGPLHPWFQAFIMEEMTTW